jgi:hypothetical protein
MMDNVNANSVHMDGIERQATETTTRGFKINDPKVKKVCELKKPILHVNASSSSIPLFKFFWLASYSYFYHPNLLLTKCTS